jgi:DNA-binding transcriptional ArsR family regulator
VRNHATVCTAEQLGKCLYGRYALYVHDWLPSFKMPHDEQVELAAEEFRLLADPTRIRILWALLQGESSVACLAELVDASPSVVSQHLSKLRLAGLVRGRRQGTFVYYSAVNKHLTRLLAEALADSDGTDHHRENGDSSRAHAREGSAGGVWK